MVLHQIILHAEFHRLDRDRFIAVAGDKDNCAGQLAIHHGIIQEFETGDVGQAKVQQQTIELSWAQRRDAGGSVDRLLDVERSRRLPRQQPAVESAVSFIIVDDQQSIGAVRVWHHELSPRGPI
jgi:hypothetical protein